MEIQISIQIRTSTEIKKDLNLQKISWIRELEPKRKQKISLRDLGSNTQQYTQKQKKNKDDKKNYK